MARDTHTSEQLDAMADDLLRASKSLKELASQMREHGLPGSLLHGTSVKTLYIPSILDWIDKAKADTAAQLRAWLANLPSKAEMHKRLNENRKLAAAKKPFKAVKKKSK